MKKTDKSPALPQMEYLEIARIKESPYNPRRIYDQGRMNELTDSIRDKGVLEPILVREVDNCYEIMAGSRRFRAAKAATLTQIPAIIRKVTEGEAIEICVTENLQRENTHELEEANGYRELLELPGYTVEAVAIKVGKDKSYVYKRLKMLDLIEPAQKAFLKGEMTAEHAVRIARLQPQDQKRAFEILFQDAYGFTEPGDRRPRTAKSLQRWIDENVLLKISGAKFKTTDEHLIAGVPSCPNCPKRTGFNKNLFNDIKDGDICTDPGCFEAKTQAHITQAIAKAEKAGKPLVKISSDYSLRNRKPGDPIPAADYQRIERKQKCSSAEPAIVTHGDDDLGLQIMICRNQKCSVHGREISGGSADSEHWRREQEKREREQKITRQARRQILEASLAQLKYPIVDAMGTALGRPLRELVVIGAWGSLWNDAQKTITSRRGWEIVKRGQHLGNDWDATCRKAIGQMEELELDRLLLEIVVMKQMDYYGDSGKDRLMELADLMKVDHKKITANVRKAINDQAKAKKKAQKKALARPSEAPSKPRSSCPEDCEESCEDCARLAEPK